MEALVPYLWAFGILGLLFVLVKTVGFLSKAENEKMVGLREHCRWCNVLSKSRV